MRNQKRQFKIKSSTKNVREKNALCILIKLVQNTLGNGEVDSVMVLESKYL
jgi:hypothetical protein